MDGVGKVQQILENISIIPKETSKEKKAKISELYVCYCICLLSKRSMLKLSVISVAFQNQTQTLLIRSQLNYGIVAREIREGYCI